MSFMIWDNQGQAVSTLQKMNNGYGCPYELSNGYKMDSWDVVSKSDVSNNWGFMSPEDRPGSEEEGVLAEDLMEDVDGSPNMEDERPSDWMPETEF